MKYLLGEASATELQQVNEWLAADTANRSYYDQLKKVWDTSRKLASASAVDENQAWARFRSRIHTENKATVRSVRFQWMKVAAAVALLISVGAVVYWLNRQPVKEMIVQAGQSVINDTLPDNSVVTINKGSSIAYPSAFKKNTRQVKLEGEAFFNVTPDKNKPFVVDVNDVRITVVGTSFNIKSSDGNTEVVVETGIVRVEKAGKTIELRANEKLVTTPADTVLKKGGLKDRLYNYYRSKEFVCIDTPLWKLIEVVNEAYNVHIVIGREDKKDEPMNVTFYNESLEQVLIVIAESSNLSVTKKGDQIILQ